MSMLNSLLLSIILGSAILIGILFGYLYFCWKQSTYKSKSKYGFLIVHSSIFYESIPKFLHSYLKNFLGLYGEYHIYRTLEKIPGNKEILINLYLPQGETVTQTEIDIVFIHTSGIYIIESKDFGGWIYGNTNDINWIQSFSKYRKYSFYNPVRQNYSHKKSLEKILPEHIDVIKTMVVFSNRSNLKKISCFNNETIIQRRDLKNEIFKNSQEKLSVSEIETIGQKLSKYLIRSEFEENLHIQEIEHLKYN